MSFFSEASLAMIPSGYKTSKVYSALPITGDGDLTFTRSNDTATRVASNGLIERVRTNEILQSNSFSDAAWVKLGAGTGTAPVLTANYTTDPFGGNNAWRLQCDLNGGTTSGDRSWIYQAFAGSPSNGTLSIYVKLNSAGSVNLLFSDGVGDTQTVTSTTWVRLNIPSSATGEFRLGLIGYNGTDTCDLSIAFAQVETGDIATDTITTLGTAVSVGPVANLPRLDYLGSSCPRLILEPQRTNLLPMSEQITNSTFWNSAGGDLTATANVAVSPDGYTNADSITLANSSNRYYVSEPISLTAGTVYTYTVYMKSASGNLNIFMSGVNGLTGQMKTVTTEWQRFTLTFTMHANGAEYFGFDQRASGASTSGTVYFWGAQVEAGAYATSYIPTLGAAVTRGTDDAYKTGISSLIGQTAGTIYLEADIQKYNESGFYAAISAGLVLGTAIYLYQPSSGDLQVLIRNSGNPDASITINSANWTAGFNKVAIAYTATTAEVFINGVSKGTTSFVSAPACSQFTIGSRPDVLGTLVGTGTYNQALLFPTRLSNDSLAALTSL